MIVDVYNNHEQYRKEQRQDWLIDRFCLKKGIKRKDLVSHSQWSDCLLLIHFLDEFGPELRTNRTFKGVYDAYWGQTYKQRYKLRPKALTKLEILAEQCIKIRQQNQFKITKIKSLRTGSAKPNNIDQDNKAKGSCLPPVTDAKREQQECRAVPERVYQAHELWW
jgi:hypothetical protein